MYLAKSFQFPYVQKWIDAQTSGGKDPSINTWVALAEWLVCQTAVQTPAPHLCWNTHVDKVTDCYAGILHW